MGCKRIPIKAAMDIGKGYDQTQVIMITFEKDTGITHVVTWGKSVADCIVAAKKGNMFKHAMGWPDELYLLGR